MAMTATFGYGIDLGYEEDENFPLKVPQGWCPEEALEERMEALEKDRGILGMRIVTYGPDSSGLALLISESIFGVGGYHNSQKEIPSISCKDKIPAWEETLKIATKWLGVEPVFDWQMCISRG